MFSGPISYAQDTIPHNTLVPADRLNSMRIPLNPLFLPSRGFPRRYKLEKIKDETKYTGPAQRTYRTKG